MCEFRLHFYMHQDQNQPDHTRQMQFRSLLLLWYQQFSNPSFLHTCAV